MFDVGDKIVYPTNGVGIIDEIKTMEISGTQEEFYIIRIVSDNSKIMIPKSKLGDVGIRGLISDDELEKLLEILKSGSSPLELSNKWSKRQREYQEIIKNGSIFDITRILKNLSELQQEKELSYSEKKIFENVKRMIISEMAHVKNIDLDKAEEMINALI
ncbi:CarD family transcriptional regulator [bacterium]|nr:CarD family transcriptional regulator [bacterium]